jgi:hypothetical protein
VLEEPFEFSRRSSAAASGTGLELLVRSKAAGYRIARKIPDGEAFARTGDQAEDPARGAEAAALIARIKHVETETGKMIRKIELLDNREVVANVKGQRIVLLMLSAGLEFADRNVP